MNLTPHRILLVVSSIRKSLRFYCEILGFEVASDTRREGPCYDEITDLMGVLIRVVFLELKSSPWQIELAEYLRPANKRREITWADNASTVRLCFTVDDLASALRKLKEKRVRSLRGPILLEKDGHRVAHLLLVRDPDGYQLELRQPILGKGS